MKRTRLTAAERREVIERAATQVFAERGYQGAGMDEIARRSGVTPPVLYDHFDSKLDLHRRLLERTREELLAMWREQLGSDEPAEQRVPRALDAWARYVEEHPYAARMYFQDPSGDPEARAVHAEVTGPARAALGAILGDEQGGANIAGADDAVAGDGRGGDPRRPDRAGDLVDRPPRRAARADRRDRDQRDLDRLRAGAARRELDA